jgi:uncharacterized membrane protein YgdD (TMEM256/DUF423 family)
VQSERFPATDRTAYMVAGVLGATGVALGAFGAHGLKGWLEAAESGPLRASWWQTATHYQVWHALLAGVCATLMPRFPGLRVGVRWCLVGTLLFSGSLYVMTLTNLRLLGAITPIGGVAFILAWTTLITKTRDPGGR